MLCAIPTLIVLSFLFNSRILQTGILQTGPNQFLENQKQNEDYTGRFGLKNLPKRLEFSFAETSCSLSAVCTLGTGRYGEMGKYQRHVLYLVQNSNTVIRTCSGFWKLRTYAFELIARSP